MNIKVERDPSMMAESSLPDKNLRFIDILFILILIACICCSDAYMPILLYGNEDSAIILGSLSTFIFIY
jgi:hypothetical protein